MLLTVCRTIQRTCYGCLHYQSQRTRLSAELEGQRTCCGCLQNQKAKEYAIGYLQKQRAIEQNRLWLCVGPEKQRTWFDCQHDQSQRTGYIFLWNQNARECAWLSAERGKRLRLDPWQIEGVFTGLQCEWPFGYFGQKCEVKPANICLMQFSFNCGQPNFCSADPLHVVLTCWYTFAQLGFP